MELIQQLRLGGQSVTAAAALLYRSRLAGWFWAPVILNAVLLMVLTLVAWKAGSNFSARTLEWLGVDDPGGWIGMLVSFLIRLALFALYFTVYKQLVLIILAPLLSLLGEALDTAITGRQFPFSFRQLLKDSWRGMRLAMRNLVLELLITLGILLFSFVPVIGLLGPVVLFLVQGYFTGFSLLDYGCERDRMSVPNSRSYLRSRRWLCIAVGVYHNVLFLLPVIGWILAPVLGMTAATDAYLRDRGIIPVAPPTL